MVILFYFLFSTWRQAPSKTEEDINNKKTPQADKQKKQNKATEAILTSMAGLINPFGAARSGDLTLLR